MLTGAEVATVGLAAAAAWCAVPGPARPGAGTAATGSPAMLVVPAAVVAVLVLPHTWVAVGAVLVAAGRGALALRRRAAAHREAARSRERVLSFCEDLAADLAAGLPAGRALASASRGWPVLGSVVRAHDLGGSVPDALRDLAAGPGAGELRLVAAAWQVGQRNGAALSRTLEVAAASIRAQKATRRVVESELASARATARLVAGLPVLTLAMGSGAGGSPVSFLFSTPLGLACLAGGLALALVGLWWIEVIAAAVEGPAP